MRGQPDPLQPHDQHELQPAAADRRQEDGEVPGRERAHAEERDVEHRVDHALLDAPERGQQHDAEAERGDHARVRPAHRVAVVRLDAVGDPDHHRDQAGGERDVAPPVDPRRLLRRQLAQAAARPDRREQADRHRDDEHEPPLHGREHAAEHEADERAGERGDAVDPEREPALALRERVGQDRARVGEDQRAAETLRRGASRSATSRRPCRASSSPRAAERRR